MLNLYKKISELRKYIGKITKNSENRFLHNKYADLNAILEVVDPALEEVGLIFVDTIENGNSIHTLIDVETGENIKSVLTLYMVKADPQSYGSAQSYNRRYARLSMLNLQTEDLDGAAASGQSFVKPAQIKKINSLILESGLSAENVLGRYGVQAVKDLWASTADELIANLERVKGAKDAK